MSAEFPPASITCRQHTTTVVTLTRRLLFCTLRCEKVQLSMVTARMKLMWDLRKSAGVRARVYCPGTSQSPEGAVMSRA